MARRSLPDTSTRIAAFSPTASSTSSGRSPGGLVGRSSPVHVSGSRTRSFTLTPPSSPTIDVNSAPEPLAPTSTRRHTISNGSCPHDLSEESDAPSNETEGDSSCESIQVIIEPPSGAASDESLPSRSPSPSGTFVRSGEHTAFGVQLLPHSTEPGLKKCFQEYIQPLVYFDVAQPGLPLPFARGCPLTPYPIHSISSSPQGWNARVPATPTIHAYNRVEPIRGDVALPPLTDFGRCGPDSPAVSGKFPYGSRPISPRSPVVETHRPTMSGGAVTAAPFFPPSAGPFPLPVSPRLGEEGGSVAWSRISLQDPAGIFPPAGPGYLFPPPPPLAPPVPTLCDLLEQGAHFASSGTCKFFDVAKACSGYGFIVDDHWQELGADVFVHYTGIDMQRGFRCLANDERVEYVLTKHSSGRFQALRVMGEFGAPLRGLADERNARAARRAHVRRESSDDSALLDYGATESAASAGVGAVSPHASPTTPLPPHHPPGKLAEVSCLGSHTRTRAPFTTRTA